MGIEMHYVENIEFLTIKLGYNKVTTGFQRSLLLRLVIFFTHVIKAVILLFS
jgi:hypothetical protein